jgi:DNA-directed RNA polymerase subunit RPC12/RpoP
VKGLTRVFPIDMGISHQKLALANERGPIILWSIQYESRTRFGYPKGTLKLHSADTVRISESRQTDYCQRDTPPPKVQQLQPRVISDVCLRAFWGRIAVGKVREVPQRCNSCSRRDESLFTNALVSCESCSRSLLRMPRVDRLLVSFLCTSVLSALLKEYS